MLRSCCRTAWTGVDHERSGRPRRAAGSSARGPHVGRAHRALRRAVDHLAERRHLPEWLTQTLRQHNLTPEIRHTAEEHQTQLAMVAAGLGIAVMPRLGRGRADESRSSPCAPTSADGCTRSGDPWPQSAPPSRRWWPSFAPSRPSSAPNDTITAVDPRGRGALSFSLTPSIRIPKQSPAATRPDSSAPTPSGPSTIVAVAPTSAGPRTDRCAARSAPADEHVAHVPPPTAVRAPSRHRLTHARAGIQGPGRPGHREQSEPGSVEHDDRQGQQFERAGGRYTEASRPPAAAAVR